MIDEAGLRRVLATRPNCIAVDTETTGLGVTRSDYLVGFSVAFIGPDGMESYYFSFRGPTSHVGDDNLEFQWLQPIYEWLMLCPKLRFHNTKFDLHSFMTIGLDFSVHPQIVNCMVLGVLHNENLFSQELDVLGGRYVGERKDKDLYKEWTKKNGYDSVPLIIMEPYACKDTVVTYLLGEYLEPLVPVTKKYLDREWAFERTLYHVERTGIRTDLEFAAKKTEQGLYAMAAVMDQLDMDPSKPKELADLLFKTIGLEVMFWTDGGKDKDPAKVKPKMDAKALEYYDEILAGSDNPTAKLVLEYRGWQKAVSSLYAKIPWLTGADGRLRCNFRVAKTRTGRLSCSDPNLQQIPRSGSKPWNGDAKQCFIAEDGFSLYEFDYSQLEFRLAAAYGKADQLIEAFNAGVDPFKVMCLDIFGEFSYDLRTHTKFATYAMLYGAGYKKIALMLGISEKMAKAILDGINANYPGIKRASNLATSRAKQDGHVKNWAGRYRHFNAQDSGYQKAFNSIVQGGGAEIVKDGILRIYDEIIVPAGPEVARLCLTVHDSVVLEIKHSEVEQIKCQVINILEDWDIGVKLAVEAKLWGTTG